MGSDLLLRRCLMVPVLALCAPGVHAAAALPSGGAIERPVAGAVAGDALFAGGFERVLRLQGQAAFLSPLAFADIELSTSDGRRLRTQADALGNFSLVFEYGWPSEVIVELRARGVDAQSHEDYASYLGTEASLDALAADSSLLGTGQLPSLHLNPYQTALYLAMRDVSVLPQVAGVSDFRRMRSSFRLDDYADRGQLLALLGAGELELPAGASTFMEALGDASHYAVLRAQADSVDCTGCDEALARVMSDPAHVPLLGEPPIDLPIHLYAPFALEHAAWSLKARVSFADDGSGRFLTRTPYGDPLGAEIAWTADQSTTRFERSDGLPISSWLSSSAPPPECPLTSIDLQFETVAYRMSFAIAADGALLASLLPELRLSRPDCPAFTPYTLLPDAPRERYATVLGDVGSKAFPDPAGSSWVLPRCASPEHCPQHTDSLHNTGVAELHAFEAGGTGSTARSGEQFAWAVDGDGAMQIEYAGGDRARVVLAGAEGPLASVVATFSDAEGATAASSHAMRADPQAITVALLTAHAFFKRADCELPFTQMTDPCGVSGQGLVFNADGTGTVANAGTVYRLEWQLDADGRVVIDRIRTSTDQLQSRTYWELVGEDAQHVYLIEQVHVLVGTYPTSFEQFGSLVAYRKL